MKTFIKYFCVSLLIFTLIFTPARNFLSNLANTRIFAGSETLADNADLLADEDNPFYDEFKGLKRINILLLGVNDGLTDTIMLASFDLKNTEVDLISIPRDTYYPREGYKGASRKINAIYSKGQAEGTALAVSETLMGMPINYYVVLKYKGVEKIVDSMGGVPMDIPFNMKYKDPYDKPPLVIDIKKGPQVLNGKKAVEFLRYRKGYPEGDLGRVKAQQTFMKSAFKQMLSTKLPTIIATILDNVESDITLGMAQKLTTKAAGLTGDSITTYTLPGGPKTIDGLSFYFADANKTTDMLSEILSDNPSSDADIEEDTKSSSKK